MKDLWLKSEGDNWFIRNKKNLEKNKKNDLPLFLLNLYLIKPKKVLEIGAANGYRLGEIYKRFKSDVTAIEPSLKAIEDGKKKFPFIKFIRSTCEDSKIQKKFDLIITNFVFHWIYRENLYEAVHKIDSMLKNKGYLIMGDFGPEYFFKKKYHHLKNTPFYTWKAPYWELFTKSGKYLEISRLRFNHNSHCITPDIDADNMGIVVLLKKKDMYIEL